MMNTNINTQSNILNYSKYKKTKRILTTGFIFLTIIYFTMICVLCSGIVDTPPLIIEILISVFMILYFIIGLLCSWFYINSQKCIDNLSSKTNIDAKYTREVDPINDDTELVEEEIDPIAQEVDTINEDTELVEEEIDPIAQEVDLLTKRIF